MSGVCKTLIFEEGTKSSFNYTSVKLYGRRRIFKLWGGFCGTQLSYRNTRRNCFSKQLCGSWVWKAFEGKQPRGFKQRVCVWKHRSAIHFQLSGVQTTRLWWDRSPHLIFCAVLQTLLLLSISQKSHCLWFRTGRFVFRLFWIPHRVVFQFIIKLRLLETSSQLWNEGTPCAFPLIPVPILSNVIAPGRCGAISIFVFEICISSNWLVWAKLTEPVKWAYRALIQMHTDGRGHFWGRSTKRTLIIEDRRNNVF